MHGMTFKDDLHRNTLGERWCDKNAKCQLCSSSVLHFTLLFRIHHEGDDPFSEGAAYLTINEYICRILSPQKTSRRIKCVQATDGASRWGVSWPHGGCLWEVLAEVELWTQGQVTDGDGEFKLLCSTSRESLTSLYPLTNDFAVSHIMKAWKM